MHFFPGSALAPPAAVLLLVAGGALPLALWGASVGVALTAAVALWGAAALVAGFADGFALAGLVAEADAGAFAPSPHATRRRQIDRAEEVRSMALR